jgi:hypothetical protein
MPVTNSSFCFSCDTVQDGVIRRSDEVEGEVTKIGMSAVGVKEAMSMQGEGANSV